MENYLLLLGTGMCQRGGGRGARAGEACAPQISADQKALPAAPPYFMPPQIFRLWHMPGVQPLCVVVFFHAHLDEGFIKKILGLLLKTTKHEIVPHQGRKRRGDPWLRLNFHIPLPYFNQGGGRFQPTSQRLHQKFPHTVVFLQARFYRFYRLKLCNFFKLLWPI